jgi:hypothetical protein
MPKTAVAAALAALILERGRPKAGSRAKLDRSWERLRLMGKNMGNRPR